MKKVFSRLVSSALAAVMLTSSLVVTTPVSVLAAPTFSSVGGWNETIYAQISGVSDSQVTGVSYSGTMSGSLSGDDLTYLVRDNNGGVRIDIPGLKPGTYTLNVTTSSGNVTQSNITVPAQDRSGYAHYNYTSGVGAYNDDGTLKSNAKVLYVTDANKNTVSISSSDGTTVTGIGHILNSVGMDTGSGTTSNGGKPNNNKGIMKKIADDGNPVVVRFIGSVTAPDGLTAYDSVDYGGTVGDNGYMARIKSAANVTLEGIGYDAQINGWGFHFIASTDDAGTTRGKSFEARNLTFWGSPEDSLGMEGQQSGSTITSGVERCWIHNCSFLPQPISNPAESDKSEGDGCCDFKRGQYMTMSYCYFKSAHKTNLVGSSDSSLQYNITWHHNMWEDCEARGPLGRQANMHIYDNYYLRQSSYAMNPRANCYIFSEYNTMEYCKNPMDVTGGGIKSYNDTLLGCSGAMAGTFVTDKSTTVSTANKYANFDTNSSLSYIPSGNYNLQTSAAEAKATCLAYSGVMKETVITEDDVDSSVISSGNIPTASVVLPFSASYGKNGSNGPTATGNTTVSNVVYNATKVGTTDITIRGEGIVFNLAQSAKVTMTGVSGSYVPVLANSNGTIYITESGTAILPAGTYLIQSSVYDPGTQGFKEAKISALAMEAANPGEVVETTTVTKTTSEATTETTTKATTGGDETTETTTSTAVDPSGAASMGTYKIGTSASGGNFNVTEKIASAGNIAFEFRSISTGDGSLRADDGSGVSFTLAAPTKVTCEVGNKALTLTNSTTFETYSYPVGTTTIEVSAGTYSLEGADSGSNSKLLTLTLEAAGTSETSTEATTSSVESSTEATTSAPVEGYNVKVASAAATVNGTVEIPVTVTGGVVSGYTAVITYDTSKLTFVKAEQGNTDIGVDFDVNEANGTITAAATNANDIETSVLFTLTFTAKATGTANIGLTFTEIFDPSDAEITPVITAGTVGITEASAATKLGDVDKDGDVDNVDAALLLKHLSNLVVITDTVSLANADCDGVTGIDMRDVIWILNNKSAAEETTETTTETTTQAPVSGLTALAAGSYDAATMISDTSRFVVTNNNAGTSSTTQVKINETGSVEFAVNDGATVTVNYKCGSSTTTKYAYVTLNGQNGTNLAGGAAATDLVVSGLSAGTYKITATQTGGTTAQIISITVAYGSVATTKESTTETTTTTTTKETTTTTTTEATTEATTQAPVASVYSHNFTANGTTSDFYSITGNLSTSKGTVTYNGLTLTQCLKMESSTSITFSGAGVLTLVFGGTTSGANKAVAIDGVEYTTDANGILTLTLSGGSHEISKGEAINLFYMSFNGDTSATEATTEATTSQTTTKSDATTQTTTKSDATTETTTVNLSGAINISAGDTSSFTSALSSASAGTVINLAPGTYKMSAVQKLSKAGTSSKPITVTSASGRAVLDFNGTSGRAITVSGSYYNLSNLTVKNGGDNGMYITGSHINVENCIFQANGDTGLQISAGGNNVLVKNCTAFDNLQTENADGFAAKLGAGENVVFDGCIAYCNSDDGWDLFSKSGSQQNKYPITLRNCIAFKNGELTDGTIEASGDRNGFKLGGGGYTGGAHIVENCIAFDNGACGFVDNNNPSLKSLKNCTAYHNAIGDGASSKNNFNVYRATEGISVTNCLSYVLNPDANGDGKDRFYGSSSGVYYGANATITNSILGEGNKYYKVTGPTTKKFDANGQISTIGSEVTINDSMFESLTLPYNSLQTVHEDMRNADGSIKLNGFLQPKAGTVIEGLGAQFDN